MTEMGFSFTDTLGLHKMICLGLSILTGLL